LSDITLRDLLEAGVHFGHQTSRWNPRMRRYIFMERNGIYILDLQKTKALLERAQKVVRDAVASGGSVMFVGTKKQAKDTIQECAEDCGQFYVTERWLGGMLTNFQTIRQSLNRFLDLERRKTDGTWELIGKKERLRLEKELEKLDRVFHGIKGMERPPTVMFVVDTNKEKIAVSEARKLNIPVVGLVDTNSDPDLISHPVPANDDAIRSIQLMTQAIATAVKEGQARARDSRAERDKAEETGDAAEKPRARGAAPVAAPAPGAGE